MQSIPTFSVSNLIVSEGRLLSPADRSVQPLLTFKRRSKMGTRIWVRRSLRILGTRRGPGDSVRCASAMKAIANGDRSSAEYIEQDVPPSSRSHSPAAPLRSFGHLMLPADSSLCLHPLSHQETKLSDSSIFLAKQTSGFTNSAYIYLGAVGRSGGLILIWDVDIWSTSHTVVGRHSLMAVLEHFVSYSSFTFINIYGSPRNSGRLSFLNELSPLLQDRELNIIMGGDYNMTCCLPSSATVRPFRMEIWWLRNDTFKNIMLSSWSSNARLPSSAGDRWLTRWRNLWKIISQWAAIHHKARSARRRSLESQIEDLDMKADQLHLDMNDTSRLRGLKAELNIALDEEDSYWRRFELSALLIVDAALAVVMFPT
ncbi:hypothetical protein Cni_G05929 [Canna indica]|uniref:Uncharacterized protein n=1 Tax=Canna indica TaxID=4628 RepID=A0AAQ3JW79_9LILI|nr:hypothetical protein Cni_G05929 [Canna indica]